LLILNDISGASADPAIQGFLQTNAALSLKFRPARLIYKRSLKKKPGNLPVTFKFQIKSSNWQKKLKVCVLFLFLVYGQSVAIGKCVLRLGLVVSATGLLARNKEIAPKKIANNYVSGRNIFVVRN